MDHACHTVRHRVSLQYLKTVQVRADNGGIAGHEIDIAVDDGKGTYIDLIQCFYTADFCQVHPGIVFIVAEEIHFTAHGTPGIECIGRSIIYDIVWPAADFMEGLGVDKDIFLFLIDQNAVLLCIIQQIYVSVAGKCMASVDLIRHHFPFAQGIGQCIVIDHLIMITVHEEISVLYPGKIGGNAQISIGIGNCRAAFGVCCRHEFRGPDIFRDRPGSRNISARRVDGAWLWSASGKNRQESENDKEGFNLMCY